MNTTPLSRTRHGVDNVAAREKGYLMQVGFKHKMDENGDVVRFKAGLVARGTGLQVAEGAVWFEAIGKNLERSPSSASPVSELSTKFLRSMHLHQQYIWSHRCSLGR